MLSCGFVSSLVSWSLGHRNANDGRKTRIKSCSNFDSEVSRELKKTPSSDFFAESWRPTFFLDAEKLGSLQEGYRNNLAAKVFILLPNCLDATIWLLIDVVVIDADADVTSIVSRQNIDSGAGWKKIINKHYSSKTEDFQSFVFKNRSNLKFLTCKYADDFTNTRLNNCVTNIKILRINVCRIRTHVLYTLVNIPIVRSRRTSHHLVSLLLASPW